MVCMGIEYLAGDRMYLVLPSFSIRISRQSCQSSSATSGAQILPIYNGDFVDHRTSHIRVFGAASSFKLRTIAHIFAGPCQRGCSSDAVTGHPHAKAQTTT